MAIDLHIHSINSDGTDTVDEIVEKALEMELEAISITDHEYLTIPEKNNLIEIIKGIEVSAIGKMLKKIMYMQGYIY